jgi:hypothetical protein
MPKLPSKYDLNSATPQPNRQILQGVNTVEQQAGADLGQAVARFGEVGMIKAREQQQKVERLSEAKAKSAFYQKKVQLDNAFDDDPDYGTYEQRYNEGIAQAQKDAAGLIKDPLQREAFLADSSADRALGNANIRKKAFAKEGDYERGTLDTDLASLRESALNAPDEKTRSGIIKTMQDRIQSVADRGHIDQDAAATLQRRSAEDYAEGFVSLKSPYEQVKILKSKGTVADFIPSDKRANLIRRAEQEIKQDQALARVSLSERTQDATAAYLQGQAFVNPPSRAEYVAAYGEQEGTRRYSELEKTQDLGKDIRHAALASPEELKTMLENADPRKGVVGEGFAGDSQRFGVLINSVSHMQKEKQTDPAAYLQKYNPKIKTLWDNLEATGDYAGYATAVTAEQQRIGVQNIKLLPEQQAKAIVAEFNKLSEGGEKSADEIQALADQWGKNWPTVYKQLSPDLPPSALVIGSGVDRPTAEILARTSHLKLDDLKKGIPTESVRSVDDAVATKFADFQQTLLQQAGGERTYSTIYDQAQRLALTYVARGEKPEAAVDRAYRSLVDDKYVIKDTYRVPKQYDAEAVEAGAQRLLQPEPDRSQVYGRNAAYAKGGDYFTKLSPSQEKEFQKWVQDNNVPFDPSPTADYDMRGFYKGLMSGDSHAETGTNANDGRMHFSDYWKTPYHKSFSAESQYALPGAPKWNERDQLVAPDGTVVFDERRPKIEVDVPRVKGLSDAFVEERVRRALGIEAYWVTNQDETGLVLYHNGAAMMKDGKPVTVSFDELAGQ